MEKRNILITLFVILIMLGFIMAHGGEDSLNQDSGNSEVMHSDDYGHMGWNIFHSPFIIILLVIAILILIVALLIKEVSKKDTKPKK